MAWFGRETADLPAAIAKELAVWFDAERNGSSRSPRRRPRTEGTTRLHLRSLLPVLRAWSTAGHSSLREISKKDVLEVLPPSGDDRVLAVKALRSLFKVLKARGLVFVNPTAGVPPGRVEPRQPLPLDVEVLQAGLGPDDPARAALTALVAFHGLRAGELRRLKLTDVTSGHLFVETRRVLLAEPVRARLSAHLDYRNKKWPSTANAHFFANHRTACRTGPVGSRWLGLKLGMAAQRIREDRILDEALATEGDLRRLCDLFGIGITAASRFVIAPGPTSLPAPKPADNRQIVIALILVALALGLDNFAVSVGFGLSGVSTRTRLEIGIVFGIFEAGMPVLGLALGHHLAHDLGHDTRWVGSGLLIATGAYGLLTDLREPGRPSVPSTGRRRGRLILTALALSIDNLAVGFALGTYNVSLPLAAIVIGSVSVALSLLGLELGARIGAQLGDRGELVGSLILIAVGTAIASGVF